MCLFYKYATAKSEIQSCSNKHETGLVGCKQPDQTPLCRNWLGQTTQPVCQYVGFAGHAANKKVEVSLVTPPKSFPNLHAKRWRVGPPPASSNKLPLINCPWLSWLWYCWRHCFRDNRMAFISKTLMCSADWSRDQTPWNRSPSGSRWAPHPERLESVKRVWDDRGGFSSTPWTNLSLLFHHSKWLLICILIRMQCSNGRTWGFHWAKRAIWRGRKCSLPKTTNWAAALNFPRRDRNSLADTCSCFLKPEYKTQNVFNSVPWHSNYVLVSQKFHSYKNKILGRN